MFTEIVKISLLASVQRHCSCKLIILGLLAIAANCADAADWDRQRDAMVMSEIEEAGISNPRVLEAMRQTRRHEFVPLNQRRLAYLDMALPIGSQQTISPPFVVAYMTEQLDPQPSDRVLEIGTGSGYQAAVLSSLVREVYSIEIVNALGKRAAKTLKRLDYENVYTRIGDGYQGWPEKAPFDKIIVTCSPEEPPQALIDQLAEGGQMVIPTGERYQQNLYRLRKVNGKLERETLRATLFVPMTGAAEEGRRKKPNPSNPSLFNGNFDEVAESDVKEKRPAGWHYVRQGELAKRTETANGYAFKFNNREPGQQSHALQGFAVDGRRVDRLQIRFDSKATNIRYGQNQGQWPYVVVTFYNEKRAALANESVGPIRGTYPWTSQMRSIPVPIKAKEAIVRIGLLGAVGTLEIDNLTVAREPER